MNIGTLNIEIATNVARIQADMQAAKAAVTSSMDEISKGVGYAKTALLGLGGALTVGTFVNVIEGAITAKAKLYDLSIQTGLTVEALSGLGKVAKYSNTELSDIASASNKLSKALFTQNEDSKGAAQAIAALGLNFKEFKALNADDQFVQVAKAMGEFEDGTAKSAAAMLLYGKTGATLLPFLKELEERGYAVGKQTTESALQAKKYEDNLITLKMAADSWKRQLAEAALPTLIAIADAFVDVRKKGDDLNVTGNLIGGTFKVITAAAAGTWFVVTQLATGIGALTAATVQMVQGDFGSAKSILGSYVDDFKKAANDTDTFVNRVMEGKKKTGVDDDKPPKPPRRRLALDTDVDGKGLKDVADGYDALMKKLRDKIDLDKREIELGRQLTDTEKLQIDVRNEVLKNTDKLSAARKRSIEQTLAQAVALGLERQAQEANLKWIKEATDANATYIEGRMQLRTQMEADRRNAELQAAAYGMTAEELQALESARLRDAAAALDRQGVLAQDVDLSGQLTQLYREQADALRGTAAARDALAAKEAKDRNDPLSGANRAVKEYLADVKRAGDATYGAVANTLQGLEDLTVTALTGGDAKNAAKAWVTGIINEITRLYIVKPLLKDIFGGSGGGGGSDLFGSLLNLAGSFFGGGGGFGTNSTGTSLPTSGGRADGGPVMAGRNYLVGERGPEILRMGSQAGTVIPNGGASRSVQVQVINNGAPVKAQQSQKETSEGTLVTLLLDAVAADINSGGKAHDAMQRRFGLNPGGATPRY